MIITDAEKQQITAELINERDERKRQAAYWEERAAIAEAKAEEWRARVLEQDPRIRRLESDVAVYMRDIDDLEARMAEASQHIAQAQTCDQIAVHLFEQRIQKAREILMDADDFGCVKFAARVLEALEGKDEFSCPHCQKRIRLNTFHECIVIPEDLEALEGK